MKIGSIIVVLGILSMAILCDAGYTSMGIVVGILTVPVAILTEAYTA